jgi:outer membrane protein assembly factor BamB
MKTFLTGISLLMASYGFAQLSGWNNTGGNSRLNGYVDVAGPMEDSLLWQVQSQGFFGTPFFIENDYVVTMRFMSLTNAPVECYNLMTGELLWSADVTNNAGRSLPVGLRDGRLFVVRLTESPNDTLYALNINDGSLLYTAPFTVMPYITETAVFDTLGSMYIGGNQVTYKMDPATGELIWETPTVEMSSGSGEMAINNENNRGYTVESLNGLAYLWATDLTSGLKMYEHVVEDLQLGGNVPQSALMVGNNGIIYVHLTQDNIAAFTDDGTQLNLLWQTEITGNSSFSLMCVGEDGSVYAPSDGKIIRLNGFTGELINESVSITQGGFFSPRLTATNNGMIYTTNGEDYVYAFDQNLNMLWSNFLPATNTSGVCIAPNGVAVVGGQNTIRAYVPSEVNAIADNHDTPFEVYPNPTQSVLFVKSSAKQLGKEYSIRDCTGRVVHSGFLQQIVSAINLPQLSPGVYVLNSEAREQGVRIVVE